LRKGDAAKVQDIRKSPILEKPIDPVTEPNTLTQQSIDPVTEQNTLREDKKQEEDKIKRVDSIKAIFSGPMKKDTTTVKSPNLLKPRARSMIIESPFFAMEKLAVETKTSSPIVRKDSKGSLI